MQIDIDPEIVLAALRLRYSDLEFLIDDLHEDLESREPDTPDWWISKRGLKRATKEYRAISQQINHIEEQL